MALSHRTTSHRLRTHFDLLINYEPMVLVAHYSALSIGPNLRAATTTPPSTPASSARSPQPPSTALRAAPPSPAAAPRRSAPRYPATSRATVPLAAAWSMPNKDNSNLGLNGFGAVSRHFGRSASHWRRYQHTCPTFPVHVVPGRARIEPVGVALVGPVPCCPQTVDRRHQACCNMGVSVSLDVLAPDTHEQAAHSGASYLTNVR